MAVVTTLVAITLLIVLVAYPIKRLIKWFANRKIVNKIPGPYSYYIIGNVFDYLGDTEQLFKNFRKMASDYNEIYKVWMGYIAAINLLIPEDIEIVIGATDNMQKSRIYEPLLPWLKTGLLTSSGKKWHTRRKILTPAFHFNILQQFVKIFGKQTRQFLNELEAQCGQPFVDIMPSVTAFALKSICETAMGVQLNENNVMQARYRKALKEINSMIVGRLIHPWFYENWIWFFTPMHWRERTLLKCLHSFSRKVIEGRKKTFDGSITNKIEDVAFMSKKRLAMLDLLLSAKEDNDSINDEGIQEEVDTFIMEGHDTTASAIAFTILCLANHSEIQDRVYEELRDTFTNDHTEPTLFDLQKLKYTEMCIKESLRMYPSVPFISRLASKDIDTFSGYRIPKGTHIHIHIYDMHRNPKIYPDPEKFDPDRFLPENVMNRHAFAFLPFSGGSRNCIGQRFAMLEIKTVIYGLLRKFKLEAVDTLASKPILQELILRPKNGLRVKLIRRK